MTKNSVSVDSAYDVGEKADLGTSCSGQHTRSEWKRKWALEKWVRMLMQQLEEQAALNVKSGIPASPNKGLSKVLIWPPSKD